MLVIEYWSTFYAELSFLNKLWEKKINQYYHAHILALRSSRPGQSFECDMTADFDDADDDMKEFALQYANGIIQQSLQLVGEWSLYHFIVKVCCASHIKKNLMKNINLQHNLWLKYWWLAYKPANWCLEIRDDLSD